MRTLFSGQIFADYSGFYLTTDIDGDGWQLAEMFAGQTNGICGARRPGHLIFSMGTYFGPIGLTIEVDGARSEIDDEWEEIVEVSFAPVTEEAWLSSITGGGPPPFRLERAQYRVRVSVSAMSEAVTATFDPDRAVERCLLQLWPAPPAPDRVLKQTSTVAIQNHERARAYRLPPPPPTTGGVRGRG